MKFILTSGFYLINCHICYSTYSIFTAFISQQHFTYMTSRESKLLMEMLAEVVTKGVLEQAWGGCYSYTAAMLNFTVT